MYGYIKLDGLSQIMSLLKYNDDPFENNWETTYIPTYIQPYFMQPHHTCKEEDAKYKRTKHGKSEIIMT